MTQQTKKDIVFNVRFIDWGEESADLKCDFCSSTGIRYYCDFINSNNIKEQLKLRGECI